MHYEMKRPCKAYLLNFLSPCPFFFYEMASGGLYSLISINNLQSLLIIFVHWTQLSEYWTHDTDYMLFEDI